MREYLNQAQEKFAQLVAAGMSGEGAAQEVYGRSLRTGPWTNSGHLLKLPKIQLRIAEIRADYERKASAKREELIEFLYEQATFDPGEVLEWDEDGVVRLKPSSEWTPRQTRMISKFRLTDQGRVVIDFGGMRAEAAKLLAQIQGYMNGDVNVNVQQFVIRAPEPCASSEEWEAEAKHFLEHQAQADLGPGAALPAPVMPSPAEMAREAALAQPPRYPDDAHYGRPAVKSEPQRAAEPMPNPNYRKRGW